MKSLVTQTSSIALPSFVGKQSMIPFDLETLDGLPGYLKETAKTMLKGVKNLKGIAYFTIHGKHLKKGQTLRRPGAHTDGNYEPLNMDYGGSGGGGNGWKVGEDGRDIDHPIHKRQYNKETGGIIICSNYCSSVGWVGEFEGLPKKGGDCTHLELGESFKLEANKVYYGNNHFIHESLPIDNDVHRVMARITLPEDHVYESY